MIERSGAAFAIASTAVAAFAIAIALVAAAALIFGVPPAFSMRLHSTDRRFLEIFIALATPLAPLELLGLLAWISVAFIAGAVLTFIGLHRRRAQIEAAGLFVIAAAGSFFWFAVMNPALAGGGETLRAFARRGRTHRPPGHRRRPSRTERLRP